MDVINTKIETIFDLENSIRDWINTYRNQHLLMKAMRKWNVVCSALDSLGDASLAVKVFFKTNAIQHAEENRAGLQYLMIYGLLQALTLQRDALIAISMALDVEPKKREIYGKFSNMTKIRVRVAGHPTNEKATGESHVLNRSFLSTHSFEIISYKKNSPHKTEYVDMFKVANEHLAHVAEVLKKTLLGLMLKDKQHKEKFKNMKLAAMLDNGRHSLSKIGEGLERKENLEKTIAKQLIEQFENIISEVKKRNEYQGSIRQKLEILLRAANKLDKFLNGKGGLIVKDAEIFHYYIWHEHEKLKQLLIEIDEEYETEGDTSE